MPYIKKEYIERDDIIRAKDEEIDRLRKENGSLKMPCIESIKSKNAAMFIDFINRRINPLSHIKGKCFQETRSHVYAIDIDTESDHSCDREDSSYIFKVLEITNIDEIESKLGMLQRYVNRQEIDVITETQIMHMIDTLHVRVCFRAVCAGMVRGYLNNEKRTDKIVFSDGCRYPLSDFLNWVEEITEDEFSTLMRNYLGHVTRYVSENK